MNREQANAVAAMFEAFPYMEEVNGALRENLDIIKAFANGEEIEYIEGTVWLAADNPGFFQARPIYRIKPNTVKVVMYLNVYPDGRSSTYCRRELADANRGRGCIACVRIELDVEEGRFDA